SGADAEEEVLRRRREAARLVAAEPVLAREHDREAPARPRRAEARLRDAERDEPRDLVRADRDRPERRAGCVLVPLAEALHLDEAVPCEGRSDLEVAR